MSSWEEPGVNTLDPLVVEPDQRRLPVGTIQKGENVGTAQRDEPRVKSRGWLALGVFFLTAAIGYGLMFLVFDNWFMG